MKVYDLIIKFADGTETNTYFKKENAIKGINQVIKNGHKILNYEIIERESNIEENETFENYNNLMNELNEL